jgi:serine/threonine protein kinase
MESDAVSWYSVDVSRVKCHVPDRYQKLAYVGRSEYGGLIIKGVDREASGKKICMKKFTKIEADDASAVRRLYKEIKLLKHVNHENLVEFHDLFSSSNSEKSTLKDM